MKKKRHMADESERPAAEEASTESASPEQTSRPKKKEKKERPPKERVAKPFQTLRDSGDHYADLDEIKARYSRLDSKVSAVSNFSQELAILQKAVIKIQRQYRRSLFRRVVADQQFIHKGRHDKFIEMVNQETTYVKRLRECVTYLKRPAGTMLAPDQVKTIFGEYEELLDYHEIFLASLNERAKVWSPSIQVGDLFLGMAPFLKLYTRYVQKYEDAIRVATEVTKSNKQFKTLLTNLKSTTGLGTGLLFFGTAMNLPVERIARYELLLKEFIQVLLLLTLQFSQSFKVDYGLLCQAYLQILGVCSYIDKVRLLETARLEFDKHEWVSTQVRKPTFCYSCHQFIVGINRHGYECDKCSSIIHKNCREKVSGFCEGKPAEKQRTLRKTTSHRGRIAFALSEVMQIVTEELVVQNQRFRINKGVLLISNIAVGDPEMQLVSEFIKLNPDLLVRLYIHSSIRSIVSFASLGRFSDFLATTQSLTDLSLSGIEIAEAGSKLLAESFQRCSVLETLVLAGPGLETLARVLLQERVLRQIRNLSIIDGACDLGVLRALAGAPHSLPHLTTFDLTTNSLDMEAVLIAESFLSHTPCQALYLSNNMLDARAMVPLTRALLANNSITKVSLHNNPIDRDGGLVLLAVCLKRKKIAFSLPNQEPESRKLFLQVEAISSGTEALTPTILRALIPEFLSVSEFFQPSQISLRGCFLPTYPFSIPPINDLTKLDLSSNDLERVPPLPALPQLETLDLSENRLSFEGIDDLVSTVVKMKALKRLILTSNPWYMSHYKQLFVGLAAANPLPSFSIKLPESARFFVEWRSETARSWEDYVEVAPWGVFISHRKDGRKEIRARLTEVEVTSDRRSKEITIAFAMQSVKATFVLHPTKVEPSSLTPKEKRKFADVVSELKKTLDPATAVKTAITPIECRGLIVIHQYFLIRLRKRSSRFAHVVPALVSRPQLTNLNLSRCRLTELPDSLQRLNRLKQLDISYNLLTDLPDFLARLPLEVLNSSNNPELSQYLWTERDFQGVQGFLNDRSRASEVWPSVKMLVLGQEGAGKTTLLNALKRVSSPPQQKNSGVLISEWTPSRKAWRAIEEPMTVKKSASASKEQVDRRRGTIRVTGEARVRFRCFDFGSIEGCGPTQDLFLTTRSLHLVVFDVSNFQDQRLDYWFGRIATFSGSKAPVLLVGTHDNEASRSAVEARIQELLRRQPALKIEAICYVDSITGTNIPELESTILDLVNVNHYPRVPKSYVELTDYIFAKDKEKAERMEKPDLEPVPLSPLDLMPIQIFSRLCNKAGLVASKVEDAANFLQDSGLALHFKDSANRGKEAYLITRPQALCDLFLSVIQNNFIENGVLSLDALFNQVWKGKYSSSDAQTMVKILREFELVFFSEVPESRIIIPAVLPPQAPPSLPSCWPPTNSERILEIGREYCLNMLPRGLFARLLFRLSNVANALTLALWRSGRVLVDPATSSKVFVLLGESSRAGTITIRTRVNSASPSFGLFFSIKEIAETLLETFFRGEDPYETRILYNADAAYSIPFERAVRTIASGQTVIEERGSLLRLETIAPDLVMTSITSISSESVLREELLGQGGFGRVWKAFLDGKAVALKEISLSDDSFITAHFLEWQREVWTMSQLKHTRLVELIGIVKNPLSIVLELIPMGDLYANFHQHDDEVEAESLRLKSVRFELDQLKQSCQRTDGTTDFAGLNVYAAKLRLWEDEYTQFLKKQQEADRHISWKLRYRVAYDIALGMEYLHSLDPPIVHRDLRSPNIFLLHMDESEEQAIVKVGDFGLARRASGRFLQGLDSWQWLPPEVIDPTSQGYDHRADIYSFAIILWELANGVGPVPFSEYDAHAAVAVIKNNIVSAHLRPSIPPNAIEEAPQFVKLMKRCWAYNPSERPSFTEVVDEFHSLLGLANTNPAQLARRRSGPHLLKQVKFELAGKHILGEVAPKSICYLPTISDVLIGFDNGDLLLFNAQHRLSAAHKSGIDAVGAIGDTVWTASEKTIAIRNTSLALLTELELDSIPLALAADSDLLFALLVEPTTNNQGAIFSVQVWSFEDDKSEQLRTIECPGLAHCLLVESSCVWLGETGSISYYQVAKRDPTARASSNLAEGQPIGFGQNTSPFSTLKAHSDRRVSSLRLLRGQLFSASSSELSIWDPVEKTLLRVIPFQAPLIRFFTFENPNYVLVETQQGAGAGTSLLSIRDGQLVDLRHHQIGANAIYNPKEKEIAYVKPTSKTLRRVLLPLEQN